MKRIYVQAFCQSNLGDDLFGNLPNDTPKRNFTFMLWGLTKMPFSDSTTSSFQPSGTVSAES